ncbi:MAG: hypothetical protein DRR08_01010 [Candidatus Parabeggiatoa sp. nov. 2]|nr:MAG: hypothetical protein B6247_02985 [Beggiatoa sp. 4572_84]RKZ64295.1 MAG: hypothetical protein DRR08_01010 [Gammaproteobacteria bacterium]HEC85082.1 hypothetical protein [Thioploca sp.]
MPNLQYLLKQANHLTYPEQKILLTFLDEQVKQQETQPQKARRKWRSIRGSAPNLLNGEDAQVWVSRLRGDETD